MENVYHIHGSSLSRIPSILSLEAYGESRLESNAGTFAEIGNNSILELITGGNGTLQCGEESVPIKAGDLLFASAPEALIIKNTSNSVLTKKYLNFYLAPKVLLPFGNQHNSSGKANFFLIRDCGEADYFFNKIAELLKGEKNSLFYYELSGLCLSLLQMAGSFTTPADEQKSDTLTMELFPRYFSNVKSIRNKLNMSQKKLYKYYHEKFNTSPMAHLIECRLNMALNFLTTQDLPIGEIAGICGYNSAAFFSREFKKKFGCSPRELRRKAADNAIVLEAKSEK